MSQAYRSLDTDEVEEADLVSSDEQHHTDANLAGLPWSKMRPPIPNVWSQSNDFKSFVNGTVQDESSRSQAMNQKARILRVLLFLVIEALWLGFGLFVNFRVVETPSGGNSFTVAHIATSRDALFKSGFSALGNLWQMSLLLFVRDIVKETLSGEWTHMLSHSNGRVMHDTDRVSTLTSGYIDQTHHAFDKRSSWRYRFAFPAMLLAFVLQTIAPGAISIGSDTASTSTVLGIGALLPNSTFPTVPPIFIGTTADTMGDYDAKTVLARKLPLKATRFLYTTMVEHSNSDFQINSNGTLFGMPPRSMLSEHLSYRSDAVSYDFDCRWAAPTFVNGSSIFDSTWAFGDVVGTLDYNAQTNLNAPEPQWLFGLWPLMLQSGPGATNGSFAWLLFGSDAAHPIDLSSIPTSGKTYNDSGWYDLVFNIKANSAGHAEDYGIYSAWASVLSCDPNMHFGTVEVEVKEQTLSYKRIQDDGMVASETIGNIDPMEAALMLGRSLNGMTWDSIRTGIGPPFDSDSDISRVAFEFALLPSKNPNISITVTPQAPANITSSIASFVMVAGSSAYLDGTIGSIDVPAQTLRDIQRLVCSWPQWIASVCIVLLIGLLLGMIIAFERDGTEPVIPLTIATVKNALGEGRSSSQDTSEEPFEAEMLYKAYSNHSIPRSC